MFVQSPEYLRIESVLVVDGAYLLEDVLSVSGSLLRIFVKFLITARPGLQYILPNCVEESSCPLCASAGLFTFIPSVETLLNIPPSLSDEALPDV